MHAMRSFRAATAVRVGSASLSHACRLLHSSPAACAGAKVSAATIAARAQAAAQRAQQAATPVNPTTSKPVAPAAPFATSHNTPAAPAAAPTAAPAKPPTLEQLAATVASLQATVAMHAAAHEAQVAAHADIVASLATSRAKFNELATLMKTLTEVLPDAGTLIDAEDQLQLQQQQSKRKSTTSRGKYMQRRPAEDDDDPLLFDEDSAPFPDVRSDDGSDPLLKATRKTSVLSRMRQQREDSSKGDEVFYAEPREPRSLIARRRPRLADRGGSLVSAK